MRFATSVSFALLIAGCAALPSRNIASAPQVHDWKSSANEVSITGTRVVWNGKIFPLGSLLVVEAHGDGSECRLTTRAASLADDGRIVLLEAIAASKNLPCSRVHAPEGLANPHAFKQVVLTEADGGELDLTTFTVEDNAPSPGLRGEELLNPALAQSWKALRGTLSSDTLERVQP